MDEAAIHPLENVLRLCAAAEPQPWYPSSHAREKGIPRDTLDPHLDELRMSGLIRLTDWVKDHGQGYALTPPGREVLDNPRLLARLRSGTLRVAPPAQERRLDNNRTTLSRGEAIRDSLLIPGTPAVTKLLIAVNILVFLAGMGLAVRQGIPVNEYLGPSKRAFPVLVEIGAIYGPAVYLQGEWWRLLTCCFVHIGLIHLAVNMYSLYAVGPLLERMWGSGYYLLLYLVAGFGGSCAMLIEIPGGFGAGASGALWGILASMVTWLFLNRGYLPPALIADWRRRLLFVFLLNLGITFGFTGISKGAHFGGGIVGLVAAVPLHYLRFGRGWQRAAGLAGLVAVPVLCAYAMTIFLEQPIYLDKFAYQTKKVILTAEEVFETRAEPLLNEEPPRRNPDAVNLAIQALEEQGQRLTQLAARVQGAGPYRTAKVEEVRQLSLQVLESELAFFRLSTEALQQGSKWSGQNRDIQNQIQQLEKEYARWDEAVRALESQSR